MSAAPGSPSDAPDLPAGWERVSGSSGAWLAGRPDVLRELAAAGFGPDADGSLVQARLGGRGSIGELRTAQFEVLVRRYRRGGILGSIRGERFADPRRALSEAGVGLALIQRGVRTPEPVGVRVRPHERGGLRLELLLERRVEAVDFGRAWLAGEPSLRQDLERELGSFVAALHGHGLIHRDLHWRNLLVEPQAPAGERLWIIDLDRASLARESLDRAARLAQWSRFWRAFDKRRRAGAPAPGATSAKRALAAYVDSQGDPDAWIRDVHARLAWRRKLQRLRPRPRIEDLRV